MDYSKTLGVLKRIIGSKFASLIRSLGTAFLTPISFSLSTGHFRSSLANKAIKNNGQALPWFTYPCIDFIATRDFSEANILEFGGGQSSKYWSDVAKSVITFETDDKWISNIRQITHHSSNISLILAPLETSKQVPYVERELEKLNKKFDVIIVDGMSRKEMFLIAMNYLTQEGIIICDNAEGYGFFEQWKKFPDFLRVDFYGHSPGVIHPHATSIFFSSHCRYFKSNQPIFERKYHKKKFPI